MGSAQADQGAPDTMKLLIFIHSLHSGGAERVTSHLANHWAEEGWQITLVTMAPICEDFYPLHPAVERISLNMALASTGMLSGLVHNLRRAWALRRLLRERKPDAALAMMTTANILLALAALGIKGLRTVGSERNYPPMLPMGLLWEGLRKHLYGHLDVMVAQTEKAASWLREHTKSQNIVVIPNPVQYPLPKTPPFVEPPTRDTGRHLLLAVGRLTYQKGFDLLIEAFAQLAQGHPEWDLYILGEGPDRPTLLAQIAAAGLQERIHLPGRVGNVGDWYEAADIYVMSSRFEGYPNTLIEAMIYGLPVVSFDCDTGPREIINGTDIGELVASLDAKFLSKSIASSINKLAKKKQTHTKSTEKHTEISKIKIIKSWQGTITKNITKI